MGSFFLDVICLLVSAYTGVFAALTQGLLVGGFITNFIVPISVDVRPEWHNPPCLGDSPLLNNMAFIFLFAVHHSIFSRQSVKKLLRNVIPEGYYVPFFAFTAAVLLDALMYFWQPMPTVVWEVPGATLQNVVFGLQLLACLCHSVIALLVLGPLNLLAIHEPLMKVLGRPRGQTGDKLHNGGPVDREGTRKKKSKDKTFPFNAQVKGSPGRNPQPPKLLTTGIYGLVRHPIYAGFLPAIWITPTMTVGHILIASMFTVYILIGTYFEEKELIRKFGDDYLKYRKTTPCYFPMPGLLAGSSKKD